MSILCLKFEMSLSYGKCTPKTKSSFVFDNDSFTLIIQSDESHVISLTEKNPFFLYKNCNVALTAWG